MAEIPVEKKSSFPWLLALLGLLLVGALLWFLASMGDDDAAYVADSDYTATPATAVAGAVEYDDLVVTRLTGDMSFMARDANGKTHFVVFDEVQTPGTAKEGRYDINPGNTLDITATMRDRMDGMPYGVDATLPSGVNSYLYATSISMD